MTTPTRLDGSRWNDLPALCQLLGYTRGAEIGVYHGAFAERLLTCVPYLQLVAVDPWSAYSIIPSQPVQDESRRIATARLSQYPGCTIDARPSVEAAQDVPYGSLDLVFIDGDHTESAVRADLEAWTPKVRHGGMIAGHDYAQSWPGVYAAVTDYIRDHHIAPWYLLQTVAPEDQDKGVPTWFWIVR